MRPNVPPRTPTTNFPPPPKSPYSSSRSNYPPPPTGDGRYGSSPFGPRNGRSAEDIRTSEQRANNVFKAWEQMRTGQGPTPKTPKASNFASAREPGNAMPEASQKASGWDRYTEYRHANPVSSPGMSRSKSTRIPKNPGFSAGTTSGSGDEPPSRHHSAYFNVSKGDPPPPPPPPPLRDSKYFPPPPSPAARDSRYFPPPPSRTFVRKEPLKSFKSPSRPESPFAPGRSTPYATAGGERTYFSSQGLGRSSSWKESKRESEWYDREPTNTRDMPPRPKSARPGRNRSATPPLKKDNYASPTSSSSSSTSSSDDEDEGNAYASPRQPKGTKRTKARPAASRGRPTPSVRVEDAEDEDGIRSSPSGNGYRSNSKARRRYDVDQSSRGFHMGSPEGFAQHGIKRDAERNSHPGPQTPTFKQHNSPNQNGGQHPLHRRQSWHQGSGPMEDEDSPRNHARHDSGSHHSGTAPMYDPLRNTPSPSTLSSNKWSDQWPFKSPKKARLATSALPPYWAVPSSVAPSKKSENLQNLHKYSSNFLSHHAIAKCADSSLSNSFTFPKGVPTDSYRPVPPLKSHSSESINLKFSPSEWHGEFTGSANKDIAPPSTKVVHSARGRLSPTKNRPSTPRHTFSQASNVSTDGTAQDDRTTFPAAPAMPGATIFSSPPPSASPVSPSGHAGSKYTAEEWTRHFKPATFAFPLPLATHSTAHHASRKRSKASQKIFNNYKRPSVSKAASVSATIDGVEDAEDVELASVTESISSKTSGDIDGNGSAMDIDPAITPIADEQGEMTEGVKPPPIPPKLSLDGHAVKQEAQMNLGDLKDVAPFAPSKEGLKNLADLSATLPFESRPSNINVIESALSPQLLKLPAPPKRIPVPDTLTQTSWERYIAQMRAYMFEWNTFNTKMLAHFNERQASVETTLKPEWMSANSDGTDKWGFLAYMQGVEEDFRVRAHWDVSWEKHRECMRGLGSVRERLRGGGIIA